MPITITKADGSKQLFEKQKVKQTCYRLGADEVLADQVAGIVEGRLYPGITTGTIFKMISSLMRKHRPALKHLFDLRKGISLMEPKYEFEPFVRLLLSQIGYSVKPNTILRGQCGEHEVDALATKDRINYFVEIKHHYSYHALTGLDESRIARAILEDVTDAFNSGSNGLRIDSAMIITNTRYSEHAIVYGKCRNILQIGWTSPENLGLRDIVERGKLYPLSCLRGLSNEKRLRLVNAGILLIKQLLDYDTRSIEKRTGLSQNEVLSIIEKAQHTTETIWR